MGVRRKVEPPRQIATGVVTNEAYRRKLAQQAEYRKKKQGQGKKRPQQADMAIRALVGDQGVTETVEKVHTLGEANEFAEFYPGTSVTSVNLMQIVQEVFETYELTGGDPRRDLDRILKSSKVGTLGEFGKSHYRPKGKTLFADDRADLTAGALLLLLSWIQRLRKEMADILIEPRKREGGEGVFKGERLTALLEKFILGPK